MMKKDLNWLKKEIAKEMSKLEHNRNKKDGDLKYQTLRDVAQKIYQLDEPKVLSQEGSINIVLDDLKEYIKEQQSLSQNVGLSHTSAGNDTHYKQYDYVLECINEYEPSDEIQNLLVSKQEEVDRAYKDGYEKGKEHATRNEEEPDEREQLETAYKDILNRGEFWFDDKKYVVVETVEITEEQVMEWLDNNDFYDHITAETVLERAVDKGELSYYGTKYSVIEAPIDEPEVTLDRAFEEISQSYPVTKEEIWRHLEQIVAHGGKVTYGEQEVLSQDLLVVPTWFDEWWKDLTKGGGNLFHNIERFYNELYSSGMKEACDYISSPGNKKKLLNIIINELDYKVEEEQKYFVSSRESIGFWFLTKDNDGDIAIGTNKDYYDRKWESLKLTEQEIKDYDERYMAFAVKVEEVEE